MCVGYQRWISALYIKIFQFFGFTWAELHRDEFQVVNEAAIY